jgi:ArsR family transcriptional regulator, virulence genes transcriptional regulator
MIIRGFKAQEELFKAFAHGKRLEIISLLISGELPVTSIYEMLDLPQANISQHLMVLRKNNIVCTKRIGKTIYYSIAHTKIIDAYTLFREYLIEVENNTEISNELKKNTKDLLPLMHDPVCGMQVSMKLSGFSYIYKRKKYVFCASGCLKKFRNNPLKYINYK